MLDGQNEFGATFLHRASILSCDICTKKKRRAVKRSEMYASRHALRQGGPKGSIRDRSPLCHEGHGGNDVSFNASRTQRNRDSDRIRYPGRNYVRMRILAFLNESREKRGPSHTAGLSAWRNLRIVYNPSMAKRASQDIKPKKSRSRKTKKRLEAKRLMLAARKVKKGY